MRRDSTPAGRGWRTQHLQLTRYCPSSTIFDTVRETKVDVAVHKSCYIQKYVSHGVYRGI